MPAPKHPNTTPATQAVKRRGQETAAAKLRAAGWTVTPPEAAKTDLKLAHDGIEALARLLPASTSEAHHAIRSEIVRYLVVLYPDDPQEVRRLADRIAPEKRV